MSAKGFAAAAISTLGIFSVGSAAQAACNLQKIAEVPITMEGLRPTMIAQVNGKDAKFLVDTGAFFGGVTEEAGIQLGMKHSVAPFGLVVQGVGGQKRDARAMVADQLVYAGMGFRNADFLLLGRIGPGLVGNIGENLMGPFDVEYDFANGVMRYFKADGCGYNANLAYWAQDKPPTPLSIIDPTNKLLLSVVTSAKVDGHTIKVVWDSGSSVSVMSINAAGRAGIRVNSNGVSNGGISYGIYGKGLENFLAPFESFAIGDEQIKNTQLRVADLDMPRGDMLLGADFFLSHRILISNSQKKVYFTYNGGPVFRLDRQPSPASQAAAVGASPAASGAVLATTPEEPKSAAEFARRAAARAARREFQPAIADYSQAIALEPDNGAYYRARGMLRVIVRQPVLAMADLDEALKRQPNDPEALLRRGELYLASRDVPRARADFEAAIKLAPDRPDLPAAAGNAYAGAGQYDLAIGQLDAWVAAHPKGENLAQVLASRCFARAASGKDLDKALADCDTAVKKDPTSQIMQIRGLALLRLNRLDEAITQYSAAIKAQPRDAVAMYGRGLAELKKGDKAAGDADVAAATALAPAIQNQFRRMGLAPDGAAGAPAKAAG